MVFPKGTHSDIVHMGVGSESRRPQMRWLFFCPVCLFVFGKKQGNLIAKNTHTGLAATVADFIVVHCEKKKGLWGR